MSSTLSQCLNPNCLHQNPNQTKFCQSCGIKLLLADHYRPIRYLGEGGFGRTFIAVDEHRRNSQCVIKQFLPLQQGSGALQKCIQLFEQEADLLDKLGKHPQIPDLLAFFEQDGKLYLIQEFISGQDLLKELQAKGRLNETQVRELLLEMLPVLDFIHNKSVIHRDIKPENIIRRSIPLDPAIVGRKVSDLVLIDFGVSKQISATVMTKIGTGIGTPGYAAPEQNRGMVHPSSDLYSLAVTAIRLLTGVLPEERNGSVVDEIFDLHNFEWVWKEWLQQKGISVNQNLAQVLDKMLQDKIANRFQSATEVLSALQSPSIPQTVVSQSSLPKTIISPQPQINLVTSKCDYRKLDRLLADGKWREADKETTIVMLKVAGREKEGYLDLDSCRNFPPQELRTIDQLWLKYSNNRFGFSVQKQIWVTNGGKLDGSYDWDTYCKLADEVGWRKRGNWLSYSDLTFIINAPKGHLPGCGWCGGVGVNRKRGWRRRLLFSLL
ncbi:serine/threonine protein kinase [Crinalium epipsammum PCC 9333]|uniref:non-specific serine/threonine protein kinase n=1 Tax=Crinalium epipsammum PCC 9333 TaxID=1173022 RepID=K9VX44_9CYAN|nr:GUN4 domain-containing protein [Crinalium epipsammum]AFZ12531.1 serine/threonine protein kinase [Crinalium epipsammum PCC 9333]